MASVTGPPRYSQIQMNAAHKHPVAFGYAAYRMVMKRRIDNHTLYLLYLGHGHQPPGSHKETLTVPLLHEYHINADKIPSIWTWSGRIDRGPAQAAGDLRNPGRRIEVQESQVIPPMVTTTTTILNTP